MNKKLRIIEIDRQLRVMCMYMIMGTSEGHKMYLNLCTKRRVHYLLGFTGILSVQQSKI